MVIVDPTLYELWRIDKSNRKNKKYMALLENIETHKIIKVHFGDRRYQQYKDRTPLKLYSNLDHNDDRRRELYFKRHGKEAGKFTPKWFSNKYLW